ncbi:MAG: putative selenate reductase subunit YgfK [Spirochaetes bacterium]|nr:putative selenate reductase subunit YgfK [Spirochaetota bacterium]
MSEIMRPIPFPELVSWAKGEYKNHGSVFGIRKEKFFRPANTEAAISLFGTKVSSPVGPAAGPHSQLAQNILAAYLAGSRFIELKTVQTMDGEELRKAVARPCINAADEGYNVEWSTELTVPQAQEEYIKAWFLCHVFAKEYGIADKCDFIFNMSVGYSLDGIKSPKIDSFLEGMKNARSTQIWKQCYEYIETNMALFEKFTKNDLAAISPAVSMSVTLSTLHGCPKEEIERIAAYLLTEKSLHTYIKCNPTLLGYETARKLMDEMGYGYLSFDDHHFKNDLQFSDAVEMLRRLKTLATQQKLDFGVKITNTFPVQINRRELPGKEMYMSGRPLFALSLNVANKLSVALNGELAISYSGGADFFNLKEILETGILPVTVATTVLKPGGNERFLQLAELGVKTLAGISPSGTPIDVKKINALAESLPSKKRYRKEYRQTGQRKPSSDTSSRALPLFDCFQAPCIDNGCPIHQRIPDYLDAVAAGNYKKAFSIIAQDNTAPSITGTICDHQCQHKCTRVDYDDPLQIRQAKLCAVDNAQDAFTASLSAPGVKTEKSAAVIGAGPAGIAAAVFLRRNGVPVTVYEKRERPFGIVQYVIPSFRISDEAIARDFKIAQKLGVDFVFNTPESYSVSELQKKHAFVVLATGAWKEGEAPVKQGQEKIIDALRFLEDSKKADCNLELGKKVAVIGGGDVAMDAARAAKRNKGVENVIIVYRRTREFMPSQYDEQELALAEGIEFKELLAPESFADGVLACEVMRLGDYDNSGRRGIKGTGEKQSLHFDTVIGAVGSRVDTGHFSRNGIALNDKGLPLVNACGESSVANVYIAGDCKNGAAVVVKAIADGKAAAADILKKLGLQADFLAENASAEATAKHELSELYFKKGVIAEAKKNKADGFDNTEGLRCLSCHALCEICIDVCPNRANVMVEMQGGHQVLHIDRMCNECGNCAVFCPYAGGKPYKNKLTVFCCEEDFAESENPGFLKANGTYKIRLQDKSVVNHRKGEKNIPGELAAMIETVESRYGYMIT